MTRPRKASGVRLWTAALARLKTRIRAKPEAKRKRKDRASVRTNANTIRRAGKAREPALRRRPRYLKRPSAAMSRADARAPETARGLEEPVRRRVAVQDLHRPGRQEGHRRKGEQGDDAEQDDDRPDHGMGGDVAQAFLQIGEGGGDVRPGDERTELHLHQGGDDGEKRQPVDGETPAGPEGGIGQAAHGGAESRSQVEHGRVEGDGVGHVLGVVDQLLDDGVAGRSVEGVGHAEAEGQNQDVPGPDDVQEDQDRGDEGQDHHGGLGDQKKLPARDPIGDDAGVEHEQPGRGSGDEPRQAEKGRGMGQLEDEKAEGGGLHPAAEQRRQLTPEPQPVIAVLEGGKRLLPARGGPGACGA